MPHSILKSPRFVSSAVRNNVAPTVLSALTKSLLVSCNADTTKFNLDPTQSYRYHVDRVKRITEDIKRMWVQPDLGNLH